MKMKKILVLFSMIILAFSITACGTSTETVEFKYDEQALIDNSTNMFQAFQSLGKEDRAFYLRSEEEFYVNIVKAVQSAEDQAGKYKSIDNATVEESGSNVIVTLHATYSDGMVNINFMYDQSSIDSYVMTQGLFVPTEVVASKDVTKADLLKEAGLNTLMGMGTVFMVLLLMLLVINCFKYIPGSGAKQQKVNTKNKEIQQIPSSTPVVSGGSENLMNDTELVAVITAAIHAANENNNNNENRLVVRSIRRAKR